MHKYKEIRLEWFCVGMSVRLWECDREGGTEVWSVVIQLLHKLQLVQQNVFAKTSAPPPFFLDIYLINGDFLYFFEEGDWEAETEEGVASWLAAVPLFVVSLGQWLKRGCSREMHEQGRRRL